MKNLLTRLVRDETGVILSMELVTIASVAVIATVVGLSAMASAVNNELCDVAEAVSSINQSYSFNGLSKSGHAFVHGSGYKDQQGSIGGFGSVSVGGSSIGGFSSAGGASFSRGASVQSSTFVIEEAQVAASSACVEESASSSAILSEEIVECPGSVAHGVRTTSADDIASLRSLLQRLCDQLGQQGSTKIIPVPDPDMKQPAPAEPKNPRDSNGSATESDDLPNPRES